MRPHKLTLCACMCCHSQELEIVRTSVSEKCFTMEGKLKRLVSLLLLLYQGKEYVCWKELA